ncbi:KpsF/GutQ family sugar-phosphate isomerase [Fundicoccus culcitae]|uniref:SIS domain-containing protein n=1 Tax=Fundicoccus culcitae TaxID=2969821 RepID=A0ABY5P4T8_9LACT|nr:SIS domain-containing protein [Fundicoccus culcitae]UUX33758.1 SIS domain-containing protein [Fundicoccus culcitae]
MEINIQDTLKQAIIQESESIASLSNIIDDSFEKAILAITECSGKVVITGVGKSGHIGKKIAATFSSTGTPSFFMHSTEGLHGDLGMIEKEDIVILISNSGETSEVISLLPTIKTIGSQTISITSNNQSTLAKSVDFPLAYTYTHEVDHLNLAPTTSSTTVLVIGDALAVTLSKIREFRAEDFHLYHPGGSLGRQLSEKEGEK